MSYSAPPHSSQSTEGSVKDYGKVWWRKINKTNPTTVGKNELLGSRAENHLDDHVLYKLFIGMSLDAVVKILELETRALRPSPSHNIYSLCDLRQASESQFLHLKRGMIAPSSLDCNVNQNNT